jgi:hypothetical protein
MATVYLAHDRKHGRDVAIKVLRVDAAPVINGIGQLMRSSAVCVAAVVLTQQIWADPSACGDRVAYSESSAVIE